MPTKCTELRELAREIRLHLIENYGEGKQLPCSSENYHALARLFQSQRLLPSAAPPPQPPKASSLSSPQISKPPPPPAQPKPQNLEPPKTSSSDLKLEKPSPSLSQEDKELRKEFQEFFPRLALVNNPLDDEVARRIAEGWKYKRQQWQALVLFPKELSRPEQQFLNNVARAVDTLLVPTGCLSFDAALAAETWQRLLTSSSLRLIITPLDALSQREEVKTALKNDPPRLGNSVLLDTGALEIYLQKCETKATLWQRIREAIGDPEVLS